MSRTKRSVPHWVPPLEPDDSPKWIKRVLALLRGQDGEARSDKSWRYDVSVSEDSVATKRDGWTLSTHSRAKRLTNRNTRRKLRTHFRRWHSEELPMSYD